MSDKAELAAAIIGTFFMLVIVVPALVLAIIEGCFGKKHEEKK